jgi:hypothetical protein
LKSITLENLTKEQFSGDYRRKNQLLNASRDTLNPAVNLETLKNRLWVTEHYRLLHGVEHAYWPHFVLKNVGNHLWKYKFNYGIKGYFVFNLFRVIQNYRYQQSVVFLKTDEQFNHVRSIAWNGFVTGAVFLLI